MKAILWLGLVGVVTQGAFAQGAREMGQGNRHPGPGAVGPGFSARHHPVRPFAPIFPLGFGDYGYGGYDYGYAPQAPSVVVVEPPPPAYVPVPVPERPPEIATTVIHEYAPPSSAAAQPPDADQPVFAIVLKNGTVLSASAVVVQDGALHIVDPEGIHQRISLDSVDREATKRVNRERKLQLQLPPGR